MTTTFANPFRPINPFLPLPSEEPETFQAGEVSYALVQNGPAVSAEETESHLDVVEVKVRWGTQVLAVSHLEAGKGFAVGEGTDVAHPSLEGRTSIVSSRNGTAFVSVPDGASATVSKRGEHSRSAKAGDEIAIEEGMAITIELDPITIEVASVRAGKKTKVGFLAALASGAAACIGLSFLGHTAIVASLAMFMPKMGADDAENISRDQILAMRAMLDTSAEKELDRLKDETQPSDSVAGGGSTGGDTHQGPQGLAGTDKPVTTKGHMTFKGADDHVRLSKREELKLAQEGGFVGILLEGAPQAGKTSPWATETQLGQDPDNHVGNPFGYDANDALGWGLDLSGTGEGGGGDGKGIGQKGIGTVGGGNGGKGKWGIGKGDKDGMGDGHAPTGGGHVAKAPRIRQPNDIQTNGRLPAEVIQRIVRQNFGRFRMCYEAGLRNNPSLSGRVVTRFVIGRDGAVSQAADVGSDLPNQEVVSCVVKSFNNLSFPLPEGGIATVTYPIALSPGE